MENAHSKNGRREWQCERCGMTAMIPLNSDAIKHLCRFDGKQRVDWQPTGSDSGLLPRYDADIRKCICASCPRYQNSGCTLRPEWKHHQALFNPLAECPDERWPAAEGIKCSCQNSLPKLPDIETVYIGVRLERRRICTTCQHHYKGACLALDNGCPRCYWVLWQTEDVPCPEGKWLATWREVDDLISPRKNRVVVMLASGPHFNELAKITGPIARTYAERIGADYVELLNTTQNWWGLEKFRMHRFAEAYERSLFIDGDLLIRDSCPDIFDLVPPGMVGMHDDRKYLRYLDWIEREQRMMCESQGEPFNHILPILNTGFVVCDREQAGLWKPPAQPFMPQHCSEQFWVDAMAENYGVFELPLEFNVQYWMEDFFELIPQAYVVHLANCPSNHRVDMARRLLQW